MSFTKTVSPKDKIEVQNAYVYGSFKLNWWNAPSLDLQMGAYPTIGLRFVCDKGQMFQIGLSPIEPDQIVQVPADKCSLKSILFTNGLYGHVEKENPYIGEAMQNVNFSPALMHYLGDFVGEVWSVTKTNTITKHYKLNSHKDAYTATTDRILPSYPHFSGQKTHNVAKNNILLLQGN